MSRAQPTSFKKRYSGGHFEPIKNARVGTQAEVEGETTKKQGVEPPLKEKKVTKTQKNTKKHKKTQKNTNFFFRAGRPRHARDADKKSQQKWVILLTFLSLLANLRQVWRH